MPLHFDIKPRLNLLQITVSGYSTGHEFLQCLDAYARHPHFHPEIDLLYDVMSNADIDVREGRAAREIAGALQAVRDGAAYCVAGVVRKPAHETLFRAATALLGPGAKTKAFGKYSEALSWLGLGAPGCASGSTNCRPSPRPVHRAEI